MAKSEQKIIKYKPTVPVLVWDGDCSFCKYWVLRMQKRTKNKVDFIVYQKIHKQITDLTIDDFKKQAWMILPDGRTYPGAGSIFQTLKYAGAPLPLFLYQNVPTLQTICDRSYRLIANNRSLMFKITKLLWGKNPKSPKNYWMGYLGGLVVLIVIASIFAGKKS